MTHMCLTAFLFAVKFCIFVFKGFIYSTMLVAWLGATGLVLVMGPSELLDFIFHGKKYVVV